MRVLILLADGVEEVEAVTIIDVLRRAELEVVAAATGANIQVKGAHGLVLLADVLWNASESAAFDALVLPGGGQGTANLAADARVLEAVQTFDQEGKFVTAICAASTILAEANILNGRKATCYPACAPQLGRSYDDVPVIADGNIITGQGPGSALLFALVLVQNFTDEATAQRVATEMLFDF